jgi:hypothetical protein
MFESDRTGKKVMNAVIDVSEDRIASIITVTSIGEVGLALAVTSYRSTLRRNTMCCVLRLLIIANVVRVEVFTAVTMRMSSFGVCRSVILVETDVSEEHITSIISVKNQSTN